jgi:hypothetical protein
MYPTTRTVALSGTGVVPATLSQASANFGNQKVGATIYLYQQSGRAAVELVVIACENHAYPLPRGILHLDLV